MTNAEAKLREMGLEFDAEELDVIGAHQRRVRDILRIHGVDAALADIIYKEVFNGGRMCGVTQLSRKIEADRQAEIKRATECERDRILLNVFKRRPFVAPEMRN